MAKIAENELLVLLHDMNQSNATASESASSEGGDGAFDGRSFDSATTTATTTTTTIGVSTIRLRKFDNDDNETNKSSRLVKVGEDDSVRSSSDINLSELKVSSTSPSSSSRNNGDNKSPSSSNSSPITTPEQRKKRVAATTHRVQSSGGLVYQSDKKEKAKKVGDFLIFIDCKLGSGSYATVYEGMHSTTKQQVAIKVIDKKKLNSSNLKYFSSEIKIMRELDSDYCIRMVDFLETHHNCYVVLEYCGGGDLNDFINKRSQLVFQNNGRMKERFLKKIIYQLSEGLEYLHRKQIMHRDLKPANLLFSKPMEIIENGDADYDIDFGTLKIADLGLAKELDTNSLAQTVCGTPLFMAPEIMRAYVSGKQTGYDVKADLWSIGVIIYVLTYGNLPFVANDMVQQYKKTTLGTSFPNLDTLPELVDLLKGLLIFDPNSRLDFDQFYNHPCIVNIRNEFKKSDENIILSNFEDDYDIIDPLEIQGIPPTPDDITISTEISEKSTPNPSPLVASSTSTSNQEEESNTQPEIKLITLFDEKFEPNPDLYTSKNYTIESSLEKYPIVLFDFSELSSSTEDKTILDNVERNLQISWVLAEMALNFERTGKLTESFALYMRATHLLQNCAPFLSEIPSSDRKTALTTFMNHLLTDVFKKLEKLHSKTRHFDPSKTKDITNVMYLSAIELTKEACCWEMIGYPKWTALYNRAFYLLSYLSEVTKENKEDNDKILHLIKIIQSKLKK